MAIEWSIKGPSFGTCGWDWGCPRKINRPPTHGRREALDSMRIEGVSTGTCGSRASE